MMKKAFKRYLRLSTKKRLLLTACILLVAIGAGLDLTSLVAPKRPATDPAPVAVKGLEKGTPKYDTALPKNKSIDSLGGWTRVSPPDRNAVYAYVDSIGSARAIVSEQELPKDFLDDPIGKTKELAAAYNAKKELVVGSTTAYVGFSTGGTESVIFTTKNLLILIKSDASIDETALKDYINSLI